MHKLAHPIVICYKHDPSHRTNQVAAVKDVCLEAKVHRLAHSISILHTYNSNQHTHTHTNTHTHLDFKEAAVNDVQREDANTQHHPRDHEAHEHERGC